MSAVKTADTAVAVAESIAVKAPTAKAVAIAVKAQAPAEDKMAKVDKNGMKARQFTYIGGGEGSPHVINFMGKQKFVRGQLTEVTDPVVLAKLDGGVATIIEGSANAETLHKIDSEAKDAADAARASDAVLNERVTKKFRGE